MLSNPEEQSARMKNTHKGHKVVTFQLQFAPSLKQAVCHTFKTFVPVNGKQQLSKTKPHAYSLFQKVACIFMKGSLSLTWKIPVDRRQTRWLAQVIRQAANCRYVEVTDAAPPQDLLWNNTAVFEALRSNNLSECFANASCERQAIELRGEWGGRGGREQQRDWTTSAEQTLESSLAP